MKVNKLTVEQTVASNGCQADSISGHSKGKNTRQSDRIKCIYANVYLPPRAFLVERNKQGFFLRAEANVFAWGITAKKK